MPPNVVPAMSASKALRNACEVRISVSSEHGAGAPHSTDNRFRRTASQLTELNDKAVSRSRWEKCMSSIARAFTVAVASAQESLATTDSNIHGSVSGYIYCADINAPAR